LRRQSLKRNEMNKVIYSIYHIPTFIHKNGSIGKIGCTSKTNPEDRVKQQGYSEYEILEEHTCIDTVSKRELELQKEYGYPMDKKLYSIDRNLHTHRKSLEYLKEVGKNARKNKTGFFSLSKEQHLEACKKGGNIQGTKLYKEKRGLFGVSKEQRIEWAHLGKVTSKPILQYDLKGNLLNEYVSQKEAERQTGVRQTYISYNCIGTQKTAGGFIWKFKTS